ncbi:MAG: MEKHLA domain-containing protein [Planctomycetaceae bacterium]
MTSIKNGNVDERNRGVRGPGRARRHACGAGFVLQFLGRELLSLDGVPDADESRWAEALFEAPFVVVAHGTEADPILDYANRQALELWETDLPTLLAMLSWAD